MKKRLNILVAVFVSLAVVAISVMGIVSEFFNPHMWYKADVYDSMGKVKEIFKLVESREELPTSIGDYYKLYDDSFFEDKSLIVLTINSSSSLPRYSINNVYLKNNIIYVDICAKKGGFAAQAFWCWLILIEVKKSDIKDIAGIKKTITEVEIEEYD